MYRFALPICLALAATAAHAGETGLAALKSEAQWQIHEITGAPVPEGVAPSFGMAAAGRLAGTGGCNRFAAPISEEAGRLVIGPVVATRMACPPPQMAVERAVFEALERVTAARETPEGITFYEGATPILRASRRAPG